MHVFSMPWRDTAADEGAGMYPGGFLAMRARAEPFALVMLSWTWADAKG
jgi:hypothetical protein